MAAYSPTSWVNSGPPAIDATALNNIEQGIVDATDTGVVEVDSFAGADDDAKLAAAVSYAAAQTYKPTMRLAARRWDFSDQVELFTGFKLTGSGGGASVEQPRGNTPYSTFVKISTGGDVAWLRLPASTLFGCYIGNAAFEGTSSSVFMDSAADFSGVLWTSVIENVGFSAFKHVFGTPSKRLALDAVIFRGFWNINNSYDVAVTIGGSDNQLWTDGCLLDTGDPFTSSSVVYHLNLDYMEKTFIGPMYITAERYPAGIRINGAGNQAGLTFHGLRIEGRNKTESSYGSVIRIEGGRNVFRDCWIAYAYSDNASSPRSNEGGMVSCLGGETLFDGCTLDKATGYSESDPAFYASGSGTKIRVSNTFTATDGGAWSQLPLVSAVNSATAVTDDTVRTS